MEAEGMVNMDNAIEIELDTLKITGDATKLYEELAKASADFLPVPRSNQGQIGQQKFKYAGYAKLMRCVRPALSAHGITVLQPLHWRDGRAITTTILAGHGASVQCSFAFDGDFRRKQKDGTMASDPQEFGRHHTYYRRYQLQAMLGLEGDSDADDLPDVNEERETTQYSEPARDPVNGDAVPAKAPKAKASAEPKPAPAEQKTETSVKPSEPTTTNGNGKSKKAAGLALKPDTGETKADKPETTKAEPTTTKTLNELLHAGMKQLGWEMPQLHAFYREHVDPADFDKAANLTIEQKTTLFDKMVKLKDVVPF